MLYIAIVLGALAAAYAYKVRGEGIFACPGRGYDSGWYLAYCNATGYGDFEHGAFWFGLAPKLNSAVREAEVLVLGNSRMQVALSTASTNRWFAAAGASHYLAGFSYHENVLFASALLQKLRPTARVYIINVDDFFLEAETAPARTVMHDPAARIRYEVKHAWQYVHERACRASTFLCGNNYAVFRSEQTGAYRVFGQLEKARRGAVSFDPHADAAIADQQAHRGAAFIARLPVSRDCVLLTMIPTVDTKIGTATEIARAMGLQLVVPQVEDLHTFDRSHLDVASAERWSAAFLEAAGPRIQACLRSAPRSFPRG